MAAFPLTELVFTPLTAKVIPILSVKYSLILGVATFALSTILVSSVVLITGGLPFFIVTIVLRTSAGIGASLAHASVMITIMTEYPDRITSLIVSQIFVKKSKSFKEIIWFVFYFYFYFYCFKQTDIVRHPDNDGQYLWTNDWRIPLCHRRICTSFPYQWYCTHPHYSRRSYISRQYG